MSVTDPNGVVTDLVWDDRGRLTTVTVRDPVGGDSVTTLGYDAAGLVTTITLPGGPTTTLGYDDAHRLTSIQNAAGERVEYTLDAMGSRTADAIKAAGGAVTYSHTRAYDELGRLLRNIGAASQTWTYAYDLDGNLTGITDPLNKAWSRAFDALDRLKQVTDPLTGVASTTYDARDNVTSVTDQRGLATSYVVDGFDEVIQITSPDTGTTVFYRDGAGNVTQSVDARGVVTNFAYDARDRVTATSYPGSPSENVTYSYDSVAGGNFGKGRLTGVTDPTGTTSLVHDRRGNVVTETRTINAVPYATAYAYDLADRLTKVTYPSGRIVDYARDSLGRVSGVTTKADAGAQAITVASTLAYKPFGPLSGLVYGNGLAATLGYDQDYRLSDLDTVSGPTVIQDLAYGYNGRDDATTITDTLVSGDWRRGVLEVVPRGG
ncbi:MAG: hypothetical protein WD673_03910, partial [Alphaproteobacteria bacterium]